MVFISGVQFCIKGVHFFYKEGVPTFLLTPINPPVLQAPRSDHVVARRAHVVHTLWTQPRRQNVHA